MLKTIKNNLLVITIAITIGIVIGTLAGRYIFNQKVGISYIAQGELIELEKMRLEKQGLESRQLFYGQVERAIKLIEGLQTKKSTRNHLVLLSEKAIYGKGIRSISKEVHHEILQQLQSELR